LIIHSTSSDVDIPTTDDDEDAVTTGTGDARVALNPIGQIMLKLMKKR